MTRQEVAALQVDLERAELAAAEAERALAAERQGRALDAEAAQRRLDEANEHARRQDAELAQVRRAYLHEKAQCESLERRLDQAAASLGAKVADVIRLAHELDVARAAIPETVTCSGCGCHAFIRDLNWNTRDYHFTPLGLCGHWLKDGKPWKLDCEPPEDVVDQAKEAGDE